MNIKSLKMITASMVMLQTFTPIIVSATEEISSDSVSENELIRAEDKSIDYVVEPGSKTTVNGFKFAVSGSEAILTGYVGYDTDVTIPAKIIDGTKKYSVTRIGKSAFESNNFIKVSISEGIRYVDDSAFAHSYNLESINLPETLVSLGKNAFYFGLSLKNINVPSQIKTVSEYAFAYCRALETVVLPEGLEVIGSNAFYDNTSLNDINIPTTVTDIYNQAFRNSGLTEVYFPSSIKNIGNSAFESSANLQQVIFEEASSQIKTLSGSVFAYCLKLEKVELPEGLEVISDSAFINSKSLNNIVIPSTLSEISMFAFYNSGIEEIYIPSSVKAVGDYAFYGNINLEKVVFLGSVENIATYAFADSVNLQQIVFEEAPLQINERAFENNYALSNVTINGNSPYTYAPIFTAGLSGLKIYVPYEAKGYEDIWQEYPVFRMFNILYDGNEHDSGEVPYDEDIYVQGKQLVVQAPTVLEKKGHSFVGWNTQADGKGISLVPGETVEALSTYKTLYAVWTLNNLNVTLQPNNGEQSSTVNTYYGSLLNKIMDPKKEGHKFIGWFTDSELTTAWTTDADEVQEDMILYAGWQEFNTIEKIELEEMQRRIYTNEEFQVVAHTIPNELIDTSVLKWTSSNPEVATVSEEGIVKTLTDGETTITLTAGQVNASFEIIVYKSEVLNLEMNHTELEVGHGYDTESNNSYQLEPIFDYVGNPDLKHHWTSTNINVVEVSQDGELNFVGAGQASIRVSIGGKEAVTNITVHDILVKPETLQTNFSEVVAGYRTMVSIEANNPDNIEKVVVTYINYSTDQQKKVELIYNEDNNRFEGLAFFSATETGNWHAIEMNQVHKSMLYPLTLKNVSYYADAIYPYGFGEATINVFESNEREITYDDISPIYGAHVYKYNTSLRNGYIYGDIYIGPDAVVLIENVQVYGNIYVMGELIINDSSFNYIYHGHRKSFSTDWNGYWPTYPTRGNVQYYSSHTIDLNIINRFISSDTVIDSLPFRIDNLKAIDGYLDIYGATLDVADLYFGGIYTDTSHNGKFILNDYYIGKEDFISAFLYTSLGGVLSATYSVDHYVTGTNGMLHKAPFIYAWDKTLMAGQDYDLLEGVSAYDNEDGDITGKVNVSETNLDINQRGTYYVTYSVIDSLGAEENMTIFVTVKDPKVTNVSIHSSDLTLVKGDNVFLNYNFETQDEPDYTIQFLSSDENVLKVDEMGHLQAVGPGSAIITLKIGDASDSINVNVVIPMESVTINKTEIVLNKGMSEQLKVDIYPADTTDNKEILWTSSNNEVVEVDENGKVIAVGVGKAVITASVGMFTVISEVDVVAPLVSISLTADSARVKKGETMGVSVNLHPADTTDNTTAIWSSSNSEIVSVNKDGMFTGIKGGKATITVQVGEKFAYLPVEVTVPLKTISLKESDIELAKGKTKKLSLEFNPSDTTDDVSVIWESNNPEIATVDLYGNVKAIASGITTISAKVGNKVVSTEVKVTVPLESISLDVNSVILIKGESNTISYEVCPQDTTDGAPAEWASSNPEIVTVDSSGKLVAKSAGVAIVTLRVGDKTVELPVTVIVPLESIAIVEKDFELSKGDSKKLTLALSPIDTTEASSVEWSSSNTSVATIDKEGKVTSKSPGTTVIKAKIGTKEAQMTIKVVIPLESISIKEKSVELEKGTASKLTLVLNPSDTTDESKVEWASSDPEIVEVDNQGNVLAIKAGKAVITTKVGSFKVETPITVVVSLKSITPAKELVELNKGESEKITIQYTPVETTVEKNVKYVSSDNKVAIVDSTGFIQAIGPGKATITITLGSFKTTVTVDVSVPLKGISFENKKYNLGVNESKNLNIKFNPVDTTDVKDISWASSDERIVSVDSKGKVKAIKTGSAFITAKVGDFETTAEILVGDLTVSYRTHVQSFGWQPFVKDGAMSGTSGQAKRLEGVEIKLDNLPYAGGIEYQTHVQSYGWMNWAKDGAMSGTSGEAKRLEGIRIKLTGELAEHYDVYYRVHAESFGWLDWTKNGEASGTEGLAKRLEGIEVQLVKKGEKAPGATKRPYILTKPSVSYTTHVQKDGWQAYVKDGQMAGTSGRALRLEGIKMQVSDPTLTGGIEYRTHVQKIGWQNWKANDDMSGTSGQALRLEAIQIRLTGELAKHYDVYYRVHAQSYGWLGWAKSGEPSGTEGLGKRLEGIEVRLVRKGGKAPGNTSRSYIKK